jgi:hypothetical protein
LSLQTATATTIYKHGNGEDGAAVALLSFKVFYSPFNFSPAFFSSAFIAADATTARPAASYAAQYIIIYVSCQENLFTATGTHTKKNCKHEKRY